MIQASSSWRNEAGLRTQHTSQHNTTQHIANWFKYSTYAFLFTTYFDRIKLGKVEFYVKNFPCKASCLFEATRFQLFELFIRLHTDADFVVMKIITNV